MQDQLLLLWVYKFKNNLQKKQIKTKYINKIQKSPESNNSNPNFSQIKKPRNPANNAATPPETISY